MTDTIGDLATHIEASGADNVDFVMEVISKKVPDLNDITAADVKTAIEAEGSSIDSIKDDVEDGAFGLSALKALIDAIPTTEAPTTTQIRTALEEEGFSIDSILDIVGALPSAADIKAALEAEGTSDLDTIASAISHASHGLSNLKDLIDAVQTSVDAISGGTGSISWPYTLTEEVSGNPIPDASVWVTSDIAGANVLASGTTNASGVVTFNLNPGTVYVWRRKSGYNFVNPDTEVVSS
jgi:hypothetical protein